MGSGDELGPGMWTYLPSCCHYCKQLDEAGGGRWHRLGTSHPEAPAFPGQLGDFVGDRQSSLVTPLPRPSCGQASDSTQQGPCRVLAFIQVHPPWAIALGAR